MRLRIISLICLIACSLSGCESVLNFQGTIYSSLSNLPIDSVQLVIILNDEPVDTIYTDNSGRFKAGRVVSCIPRCPKVKLHLSKNGYGNSEVVTDFFYQGYPKDTVLYLNTN